MPEVDYNNNNNNNKFLSSAYAELQGGSDTVSRINITFN